MTEGVTEGVAGRETIEVGIGIAGDTSVTTEFFGMTEVGSDGDGEGGGGVGVGTGPPELAPPFRSIVLNSLFIVFSFFTFNGLRLL